MDCKDDSGDGSESSSMSCQEDEEEEKHQESQSHHAEEEEADDDDYDDEDEDSFELEAGLGLQGITDSRDGFLSEEGMMLSLENKISPLTFCNAFPFHLVFDRNLHVKQVSVYSSFTSSIPRSNQTFDQKEIEKLISRQKSRNERIAVFSLTFLYFSLLFSTFLYFPSTFCCPVQTLIFFSQKFLLLVFVVSLFASWDSISRYFCSWLSLVILTHSFHLNFPSDINLIILLETSLNSKYSIDQDI